MRRKKHCTALVILIYIKLNKINKFPTFLTKNKDKKLNKIEQIYENIVKLTTHDIQYSK